MDWTTIRVPPELKVDIEEATKIINKTELVYIDADWKLLDYLLKSFLKQWKSNKGTRSAVLEED